MLAELKQAHEELLGCIAQLEAFMRDPAPERGKIATARLNLSRASGKRRRLVDEACTRLLAAAHSDDVRRVNMLRENSAAMLSASSQHVGDWSIDRIVADWEGYRRASESMRRAMRERISTERSVLYPLLERAVSR